MIRSSDADGAVRAESAEEWAAFIAQWHLVLNATFSPLRASAAASGSKRRTSWAARG